MNRQSSKPKAATSTKRVSEKTALPKDGPLHTVVVEHTNLDVIVVDTVQRTPIGRPYLTLAMDVYSRAVTGFTLSLDAGTGNAIGICIAHSILPKEAWLEQRQIKAKWPIWGAPATIMADNALEFHSPDLAKACAAYGINIASRPLGTPHYAGPIEKIMGALSKEMKKLLASSLTLEELEKWLAFHVIKYNNTMNSHIHTTPLAKYREGLEASGVPPRNLDEERVRLDFLPTAIVTVQKYGIRFNGAIYVDAVLAPHLGIKDPVTKRAVVYQVRYNPRDLDQIYFYDAPNKAYHKIPRQASKAIPTSVKAFRVKPAKAPTTAQWAEAKRRWKCVEPLLKAGNKRTKALVSKQAKKFGYSTATLYRWLDILTSAKSPSVSVLLPL